MRPFYDLIANIAAEEFGHIELVSYAINLLLTGTTERGDDPSDDAARLGGRRPQQLPLPRQRPAGAADGLAGQLLDRRQRLLQRQPQAGPAAQLLPRVRRAGRQDPGLRDGGRSDRPRLRGLPAGPRRRAHRGLCQGAGEADRRRGRQAAARFPTSATSASPRPRKHEARGLHRILYQFSPEDYPRAGEIWNGQHPEDGSELEVQVGGPEGVEVRRISMRSRSSPRR